MPELSAARQQRLALLADRTARQAAILWRKRMHADFDHGWALIGPALSRITAAAQVTAAAGASAYLTATARADGMNDAGASAVIPSSWAGIDGSGRTLDGLLYGSVTTSKSLIGRGAGLPSALQAGQVYLQTMVRTATLDTARSAGLTAATAHRYTHWVRAIQAGACSRCAMLAGTASARTPFARHPGCNCTAEPVTDDGHGKTPARFTSPSAYFESLPAAEQDRIFTKAGAEAIRAGADPLAVVSARRGAVRAYGPESTGKLAHLERVVIGQQPDGSPVLGYVTAEGTTTRGAYAKQQRAIHGQFQKVGDSRYRTLKRARLMPETIVSLTDDVELRRVLLRDAGYLSVPTTAAERGAPLGGGYFDRRAEMIRQDRATADAFYRQHGIRLGG